MDDVFACALSVGWLEMSGNRRSRLTLVAASGQSMTEVAYERLHLDLVFAEQDQSIDSLDFMPRTEALERAYPGQGKPLQCTSSLLDLAPLWLWPRVHKNFLFLCTLALAHSLLFPSPEVIQTKVNAAIDMSELGSFHGMTVQMRSDLTHIDLDHHFTSLQSCNKPEPIW